MPPKPSRNLSLSIYIIIFAITMNLAQKPIFRPDLMRKTGLLCYQCQVSSQNITPHCDDKFFKLTRSEERLRISFQCPYTQDEYCFKKVIYHHDHVETLRGCSGTDDINAKRVKFGCMLKHWNEMMDFCVCQEDLCNFEPGTRRFFNVKLLAINLWLSLWL